MKSIKSPPVFVQGSPSGFGGIACLYILGTPDQLQNLIKKSFHSEASQTTNQQKINLSLFGPKQNPIDQVLWAILEKEESFFQRLTLEINLHGGPQIVDHAKKFLSEQGIIETPFEQILETSIGSIEAKAYKFALEALSPLASNCFLQQYQGSLRLALQKILAVLSENKCSLALTQLEQLLKTSDFGMALSDPISFVLCGSSNVGKSSLFNRLLGEERSIVSSKHGTTIDLVQVKRLLNNFPILISDSAGLTETPSQLEQLGAEKLQLKLKKAIPIWVFDATKSEAFQDFPSSIKQIIVLNKMDLGSFEKEVPPESIAVSALRGERILELENKMSEFLPKVYPADKGVLFTQEQIEKVQQAKIYLESQQMNEAQEQLKLLL